MLRRFCLCMLWLGLLLVRFSRELSDISSARKLCGRYLVKEIEKLCGHANWSQFHFEEETPFPRLIAQASEKVEAFSPYRFESPQTAFPARGRGTNPVSTSASWEEAVNNWEMQSLPEYQDKKAYSPLDKEREFSSSHNINLYIHENAKFQKKSRNKIKTLSNLFWGNHPQRKRRGYSEKCCLTGCTKEELSIACLPYIDFKRLKEKRSSLVTKIH
ncbi:insulin-like peptide INSL6 [Macaca thibetana thibetana]|uniref:Insulin like 6 n=4 Tax=Macaca TaxID=9539 RepID=F7G3C9_MACMU|nr:insulin-like peptide INSL6 [Macaca mulatta]XP_005581847.1 insulin-like peptide INSL6 [Macaca fascicularis]XP_050616633.1 insulin-like peptide INSL6 [Macaca thibetana thibetana]EHH24128.1 Insulin-like peptide INSL6 [Macaca mulatta]EHH57418.1 Insulin-like peptide INSL6 [Macaca fascicularis]